MFRDRICFAKIWSVNVSTNYSVTFAGSPQSTPSYSDLSVWLPVLPFYLIGRWCNLTNKDRCFRLKVVLCTLQCVMYIIQCLNQNIVKWKLKALFPVLLILVPLKNMSLFIIQHSMFFFDLTIPCYFLTILTQKTQ